MTPDVSVIVPVYHQGRALAACLHALYQQTYNHAWVEVIVVDNGSTAWPAWLTVADPLVRVVVETQPGSYAARNRGIHEARAEILAFLDADCVPAPDWIARGLAAVRALPGPGFVGGRIDLTFTDPHHLTGADLFEQLFAFPQRHYIESFGFSVTANLWTTQATFDEVGRFDTRLFSGADMEWGQRVSRRLTAVYADDVRVSHPARHTLGALCQRARRVAGGTQQRAELGQRGIHGLWWHVERELLGLRTIRRAWAATAGADLWDRVRLVGVTWIVEAVQFLEQYRVHCGGTPRRA